MALMANQVVLSGNTLSPETARDAPFGARD